MKNDIQVLKDFKKIKIPKILYDEQQYDLIDNHMILLSQIDSVLSKNEINKKYVNIVSKEDFNLLEKYAIGNDEIVQYLSKLNSVIDVLNRL